MAAAHCAAHGGLRHGRCIAHRALPVVALLGLVAMLWVAEGRRSQVLPMVLIAVAGALVLVFACYGFSPDAFSYVFRSAAGFLWVSLDPARRFFSAMGNAGITWPPRRAWCSIWASGKSRYFGNTLRCCARLSCLVLVMTRRSGQLRGCGRCRFC
jgi:hypothetical protein